MKSIKSILLGLALVLTGATATPAAVVDGNTAVKVDFLETSDGTWAFIRVISKYGILVSGDMTVGSNGDFLKMEPVTTSSQALVTAYLGPNGKTYQVCADYEGTMSLGGDNYRPVAVKTCVIRSPLRPVARFGSFGAGKRIPFGMGLDGLALRGE